ncbi:MAG: phosphatase PAP2 family protein [Candidatus Aenigmarchaeota archaeon]|nr:phosphatase PAP2 family protein [Candidatus Aenigmarchaeota archaeon]
MYEQLWVMITLLGSPLLSTAFVICLTGIYFLLGIRHPMGKEAAGYRRLLKKYLLLIIPALAISMLGSELLKLAFMVPRPCIMCPAPGCNPYCPITFSFPSGHAATSTGIVTALYLLLRRRRYLPLFILPLLVAASRIILDVHTVTDVAAGLIFGFLITMLVWRYRKRLYKWEDEIL